MKVSMELYSLQELLKQYLDWGFDFASISIATQIPEEELWQLYSNRHEGGIEVRKEHGGHPPADEIVKADGH